MAEHAYQQTRQMLRAQFTTLNAKLQPHGIGLNRAVLDDASRHLLPPLNEVPRTWPTQRATRTAPKQRLKTALNRLQDSVDDLEHALCSGAVGPR